MARSGRPGPVHLTIPSDVLSAAVNEADVPHVPVGTEGGNATAPTLLSAVPALHGTVPASPLSLGDPGLIREAVDLLARAERPSLSPAAVYSTPERRKPSAAWPRQPACRW